MLDTKFKNGTHHTECHTLALQYCTGANERAIRQTVWGECGPNDFHSNQIRRAYMCANYPLKQSFPFPTGIDNVVLAQLAGLYYYYYCY